MENYSANLNGVLANDTVVLREVFGALWLLVVQPVSSCK